MFSKVLFCSKIIVLHFFFDKHLLSTYLCEPLPKVQEIQGTIKPQSLSSSILYK